jgi:hypothetical protein
LASEVPPHRALVHVEDHSETQHRLARSVTSYDLINLALTELSVRLAKDLNLAVSVHSRSCRSRQPALSHGDKVAQVIRGVRKTSS